MAVKSEVKNNKPRGNRRFPKLMIAAAGYIVLFTSPKVGMIVFPFIGNCGNDWDMPDFADFEGSITLSNED